MRNRYGWTATVALGLLLAAPAWAEETEEAGPVESGEVEFVYVRQPWIPTANTIVTKLAVPLQLTPANVGSIGEALLREQSAVVLGDALSNVSSLNVQSGSGVHDFFTIRGFDSLNGSAVLTDGAQEPEVTYYPMYNVEGIEVLKGPAGFLYGSNPLAGVVNIVRKQPVPNDLFDVSVSGGSFGTIAGQVDWNVTGGDDFAFRLNGFWRETDGYRDGRRGEHFGVNPSLAWRVGDATKLNLSLEYVDASFTPDSGLPLFNGALPDVPRKRSYQSPLDFSEQELARVQVDVEHRLGDNLTLRNKTYHRSLDWRTNGTLITGVFPDFMTFQPTVNRALNVLADVQDFVGNQFELVLSAETGRVSHELLAGVEIGRYEDEFNLSFGLLPGVDLFNPMETTPSSIPLQPLAAGNARSDIVAPYLVDQIRFSHRFQVLAGLRYDNIDYRDPVNGIDRDDSELSPMLGVVLAPSDSLTVYANASNAYAPASPRVVGNRVPEKSTQAELGVKKKFRDGKLHTTFAVYQLDRDNIAIPDDNGITQQAGDQRSRGFELELAASPTARTRLLASYAYTDAELTRFSERIVVGFDPMTGPVFATVDRSGNAPAFAPEQLLRVWASHRLGNRFGFGGGLRYIGDQFIAEDNAYEIDAALIVDATVFVDFERFRIRLNLENVTDEEYETRGFGSTSVIPADPFAAYLGVEYRHR